jgi:pimeloyl-ACP methyl ester carboxylesterase
MMQFPFLNYPFPVKSIEIKNNILISYFDEGKGDNVLLFIHGLGSYAPAWIKNIPVLKNHFRCIAIDLPGYGKSAAGVYPGTMSFYSEVINNFLIELGLKKITIVGHSMGGFLAVAYAITYPDAVEKLILIAPACIENFTEKESIWIKDNFTVQYYSNPAAKVIRQSYNGNFYKMPADAEFMIEDRLSMTKSDNYLFYCQNVINSLYGVLNSSSSLEFDKIKIPSLFLWGNNDRLIPHPFIHPRLTIKNIAADAAKSLPLSKTIMINECGHFIPFEKPEVVNESIINFFSVKLAVVIPESER